MIVLFSKRSFDEKRKTGKNTYRPRIEAMMRQGELRDHHHHDGEYPFEWMGVYQLKEGAFEYLLKAGPDKTMKLVVIPAPQASLHAIEQVKERAIELFSTEAVTEIKAGQVIQPAGKVYLLHLKKADFRCTIEIALPGAYAVFTEHVPAEFDTKLRGVSGFIEPAFGKIVADYHHGHHHDHDHGHGHRH